MPATYDLRTTPQSGRGIAHGGGWEIRRQTVSIAALATQAAGDIIKMIPVNAGEYVRNVWIRVLTASATGSSTIDIGDSSDPNGWIDAFDATTAASNTTGSSGALVFTQAGSGVYGVTWHGGKGYAAADYVALTLGSTPPAAGIYEVIVEVLPATSTSAVL